MDLRTIANVLKVRKMNKKIYETFKGSSRVPRRRSFFPRNLFKFRRAKKWFRKNIQNFYSSVLNLMVSYKTPIRNHMVWQKILKDSYLLAKPFVCSTKLKKVSSKKGSSPGYTGRPFKGFVDFFIRFLKLSTHLQSFSNLPNRF